MQNVGGQNLFAANDQLGNIQQKPGILNMGMPINQLQVLTKCLNQRNNNNMNGAALMQNNQ